MEPGSMFASLPFFRGSQRCGNTAEPGEKHSQNYSVWNPTDGSGWSQSHGPPWGDPCWKAWIMCLRWKDAKLADCSFPMQPQKETKNAGTLLCKSSVVHGCLRGDNKFLIWLFNDTLQAFLFFENWKEDLWMKRFVRDRKSSLHIYRFITCEKQTDSPLR